MKNGLKAAPYVSMGVKFLSALFGGSGGSMTQLAPLSVNLDVRIAGNMETQYPMHNVTIGLPGSQKHDIIPGLPGGQPLYNETMGLFALINKPVMYYTEVTETKTFTNRERLNTFSPYDYMEYMSEFDFVSRKYKMSGQDLKYAINPASGMVLQDAEVMLIAEYEKPSLIYSNAYPAPKVTGVDTVTDYGLAILGTDRGPAVDLSASLFQNAYKPIGIYNFANDYSFTFLNRVTPKWTKKRELKYNLSAPQQFTCQDFQCTWANVATPRPFVFVQTQPAIQSVSSLMTMHFKNRPGIPFPYTDTPLPEFLEPRIKSFKLKFVLNLKRSDDPDAQNVLYVVTYPIELKPAPGGYNFIGSNYIRHAQAYHDQSGFMPAVPKYEVIPITTAELTTFCESAAYKTNRNMSSPSGRIAANHAVGEFGKPILYPVPAKGQLHIVHNGSNPLSITDIYGKTIKRFDDIKISGDEIKTDISSLTPGLYLLSYHDKEGNVRSVKFIVE